MTIPENVREAAQKDSKSAPTVTWIIEVSSQVLFSTTATVSFELLVGRDERSVDVGFPGLVQAAAPVPGHLHDHQRGRKHKGAHSRAHARGVFSKAIEVDVEDTASLWDKPAFPSLEPPDHPEHDRRPEQSIRGEGLSRQGTRSSLKEANDESRPRKRRKVHLVVLTHGLHSNTGSDMLYMKESIDTTVRESRYRKRKESKSRPGEANGASNAEVSAQVNDKDPENQSPPLPTQSSIKEILDEELDSDDDEQVIVRGFSGNAVKTEKGVQYLGKRLAKWVLSMTYPDQPFIPTKKSMTRTLSRAFTGSQDPEDELGKAAHVHSSIHMGKKNPLRHDYKVTSISFVGHSLGGLTQTYAIAYIQKHSPHFFEDIKPINFVALASPLLGLSNENPMYVKFALDFGLVGRTGQDLGLAWRAPTMVRSGWDAMIGGIGAEGQRVKKQPDPGSKPLLRVLPTGPAHHALKLFRNRTVYSNVVNDGIVPLRTSCLLFLDWSGLGRVEKARRENGFVGTMASWGWAEATGQNSSSRPLRSGLEAESGSDNGRSSSRSRTRSRSRSSKVAVPQPAADATGEDNGAAAEELPKQSQFLESSSGHFEDEEKPDLSGSRENSSRTQPQHPLAGLFSFLRPSPTKTKSQQSPKSTRIYKRSQTRTIAKADSGSQSPDSSQQEDSPPKDGAGQSLVRGDSASDLFTPPKTTFFEAAGDILNPPLPSLSFIINPATRPRTIFHDRVYHPEDIPPPPQITKKPSTLSRSFSSDRRPDFARTTTDYSDSTQTPIFGPSQSSLNSNSTTNIDSSGMKPEEKIARAYHHELSWRKVLVRLERESHNNIFVRRMFANAYGWPVVKHLCDTHFSDSAEAETRDEDEHNRERARPLVEGVDEQGREVKKFDEGIGKDGSGDDDDGDGDNDGNGGGKMGEAGKRVQRTDSEQRESGDLLSDLRPAVREAMSVNDLKAKPRSRSRKGSSGSSIGDGSGRRDSVQWDDKLFEETSDDDDDDHDDDDDDDDKDKGKEEHDHNHDQDPGRKPTLSDEDRVVASPEQIASPVALRSNIVVGNSVGGLQAGTGSLGLGKSVEEKLASLKRKESVNDD